MNAEGPGDEETDQSPTHSQEGTGMGVEQQKSGESDRLSHGDEVLLRWYFTIGQTVFLGSSQGGTENRLKSRAYNRDSEEMQHSRAEWQAFIRAEMDSGRSRCELPWEPQITARPTAETSTTPDPEIDDRDWSRIAEASSKLTRLKHLAPHGEAVFAAMYGDHGLEWPSAGFRHGALYAFDEDAVRLLGRLRKASDDRRSKAKVPKPKPADLDLMLAEQDRAAQFDDVEALRELQAIDGTARKLLESVARAWNALEDRR